MKIFIPTWKRLDKQQTLNSMHDTDNVWLVVRPEEEAGAREIHKNVFVLDDHVSNFPETVENIVMRNVGERVLICDDDIKFVTFREDEPTDLGYARWTKNIDAESEKKLRAKVNEMMDNGYVHGGFWHAGLAAKRHEDIVKKPVDYNARYNNVKWYDLSAFDPNDINWTDVLAAEDYHVEMQLILKGYDAAIIRDFAFRAAKSHSKGGCSEYRTNDVHNQSQLKLAELYPDWITANPINDKGVVTVNIAFKKAAKWAKEQQHSNDLSEFFS